MNTEVQFKRKISFKVGNGRSISFWEDPWCQGGPLKWYFPIIYSMSSNKLGCIAEFVMVSNGVMAWNLFL
ncbi:hypothetical protein BVC80_609g8 [Macleaya cordata]|uniref:Reverse transcriptase zinc-binding domain n=1 Tax=Macleaya cordata TaxID=56857 RepID=A0A200R0I3_MACCD|nr:hypothetical protein BVC80_609g8 [Macleaya cordata]